ncbi:CD48 antigen-like isoform X2 [Garra rufa]|uniref:CD48 antigen-like isoform X2 n=1 Tax=Garra rufa TaxID=137080 RepID=UPI003CCEBC73
MILYLFCLCFFPLIDAETDEIVSAINSGSFTLRTGFTEIQSDHEIEWRFGSRRTLINAAEKVNLLPIFRDRLLIQRETGDLTITNITNEHTGVYELSIVSGQKELQKKLIVTVYAPVPVPVITRYSPQCSSLSSSAAVASKTVLLCSVLNVSHVTLSWYKENSLLSNISVSDLSISLSLPLEVEHQDENTYSCVVNNPVSQQTKHLDIDQLCQKCSDCDNRCQKEL